MYNLGNFLTVLGWVKLNENNKNLPYKAAYHGKVLYSLISVYQFLNQLNFNSNAKHIGFHTL